MRLWGERFGPAWVAQETSRSSRQRRSDPVARHAPTTGDGVPYDQDHDRPENCHQDARKIETGDVGDVKQRTGDVAADDCPDDAQQDGSDDPLTAPGDHVCDEPGDRPKDDPRDDPHTVIPPHASGGGPPVDRLDRRALRRQAARPSGPYVRVTDRPTAPASE